MNETPTGDDRDAIIESLGEDVEHHAALQEQAEAKLARVEAERDALAARINKASQIARDIPSYNTTHWDTCHEHHADCLAALIFRTLAAAIPDEGRLRAEALRDAAEFLRGVDMPEAADLLVNLADGWAPRDVPVEATGTEGGGRHE